MQTISRHQMRAMIVTMTEAIATLRAVPVGLALEHNLPSTAGKLIYSLDILLGTSIGDVAVEPSAQVRKLIPGCPAMETV